MLDRFLSLRCSTLTGSRPIPEFQIALGVEVALTFYDGSALRSTYTQRSALAQRLALRMLSAPCAHIWAQPRIATSSGTMAGFRPLKYYTDLGYPEDKVREYAVQKEDPKWGTMFKIEMDLESFKVMNAEEQRAVAVSETAKRQKVRGALAPTSQGRAKKVAVPSIESVRTWSAEQRQAWVAWATTESKAVEAYIVDLTSENGFDQAPEILKQEAQDVSDAAGKAASDVAAKTLEELKAPEAENVLRAIGALAKRKRALTTNWKSIQKVMGKIKEVDKLS